MKCVSCGHSKTLHSFEGRCMYEQAWNDCYCPKFIKRKKS